MKTLLNHVNLSAPDVPALARFFQTIFHFRTVAERGAGALTVLESDGFLLTLMRDRSMDGPTYPGTFHVGFLQSTRDEVHDLLQRIRAFGLESNEPKAMPGNRFGFYVTAPGGVIVEVSTTA